MSKNMAIPTSIIGKSAAIAVTTDELDLVKNVMGSNSVIEVNAIFISSIHASAAGAITVKLFRGEIHTDVDNSDPENPVYTYTDITYNITPVADEVVNGNTVNVIRDDGPIYLEEGHAIRVEGGAADSMTALATYKIYS